MSCNLPMLQTGLLFFTSGLSIMLAAFINIQILGKEEKDQQFEETQTLRKKLTVNNATQIQKKMPSKMNFDFFV